MNNQLSDVELYTAMYEAKKKYEYYGMTNTWGKTPEQMVKIGRAYRLAEREYNSLLAQCYMRGIA